MAVLLSGFRSKKNRQRRMPQVFRWKKLAAQNAVPISDQRQAVALPLGFLLKMTGFPFSRLETEAPPGFWGDIMRVYWC
ncbi:hypothetical protein DM860_013543 [Cuscuta australis]|uniref:Uncharacterized protein n=1 Tax=Cuscuta australis TaxID=267555 RepID=A0A328EAI4_9ASTE|nr:hypothetical protein DM860_013543 [Cuscuta australis]